MTAVAVEPEDVEVVAEATGGVLLTVGTVASGLLAYAFNAVVARALGPEAYGPIAVLWAATFLVAVVLFRPVEQTLSRGVAERLAAGQDGKPVGRAAAWLCCGAASAAVAACILAWTPITDRLFDGHEVVTAMLVLAIVGYAASYFVRGLVGGRRWFAGYGSLLLADGGVRLVFALPLLVVASTDVAAVAIAAAAFAGAVVPLLLPGWRARRTLDGAPGPEFDVAQASRFAGPVAALAAADQVLLSGGPVLVMLAGGPHASAAAAVVFAATMLVRAPAYLFQGLAAALLPNLTTLQVQQDEQRFRQAVGRVVLVLGAFSLVMVLGALTTGPTGMHLLYGDGFAATRGDLAMLAAGAGFYLVAATLTQAALARDRAVGAAFAWTASAALFVVLELTLAGPALHRVALAFAVAALLAALACAAVTLALARERALEPSPRTGVRPLRRAA